MSIDLTILLLRNKIRLSTFCQELNISSYEALVEHCKSRDIVPCMEAQWAKEFPPVVAKLEKKPKIVKQLASKKPKTTSNAQKKTTRTTTRRKAAKPNKSSAAQKKK